MYVCVRVSMCVRECVYTYIYTCVSIQMCVCIYTYISTRLSNLTSMFVNYTCINVYMYICMLYGYIYICI